MSESPQRGAGALNALQAGTLVRALVDGGAKHAVISPGSRSTPLVLALHALAQIDDSLTLHTVLDERSAGFFALGIARASGAPVLLSCTSGSAGAHWYPALLEADAARVPLIALTADRPAELQGFGAPQTMDQTRLFGGCVRLFRDLSEPGPDADPRWLLAAAAQALDAASGVRPGPVHLNLPFRKPLWDPAAPGLPPKREAAVVIRDALPPLPAAAKGALLERLQSARRGVIVCGPMDLHRDARRGASFSAAVRGLAAALGWPLIAEPASQARGGFGAEPPALLHPAGRLVQVDPMETPVISCADAFLRSPEIAEALAPDLVLRFGRVPTSKPVTKWVSYHGEGRTLLVDPAGAYEDPTWAASVVVACDEVAFCDALAPTLLARGGDTPRSWSEGWLTLEAKARAALRAACDEGLWSGAIAREVARAAAESDALLHAASSMPIRDLDSFSGEPPRPLRVAANRGLNGIDGLLATALGEAVGGEVPVIALSGDLSFLHDAGSLALARAPSQPVVVVVIDNDGGGIFGLLPIADHPTAFAPHFLTPQDRDMATLCEAHDVTLQACEGLGELRAGLAEAMLEEGLSVLYLRLDRDADLARRQDAWAAAAVAARTILKLH
jgi:2-succinyl-5-enolpyruvyl-6-hydroxy-3-cyclohexene-1-carboxylate synthase